MSIFLSNVGQKNISTRSLEFLNFFLFIMGLDEHGSKTSYIDNPSQKNAFFRLLHPFLSASQMNDPIRQHWKTQSLKSPKSKNHLYKKLLHVMFMITVKIIFTVFWLFCWHLKDILSNKTAILEQQSYWHHLGKCFVSTIWHLG